MPIKKYQQPPYFDDFDELKNYMRILFRPGVAVQARELTQLQTILQAQIDRHGRHVFKDGSPVVGGNITLRDDVAYIKVESTFTFNTVNYTTDNYFEELVGTTLTGLDTGVTAIVLEATPFVSAEEPLTLFVRYISSGNNNTSKTFNAEEILQTDQGTPRFAKVKPIIDNPFGLSTFVSIQEGSFFVSGNFVYSPAGNVILSKYTGTGSGRVVYKVTEKLVTPADDVTINDNALGTPNESAPGAHRYQIKLELGVQDIDLANRDENNIIQLLVVTEGKVQKAARTEYSDLGDTLAQRTFEESGNYTVRPFQVNLREHLKDDTLGGDYQLGYFTAAQGGDATKLAVGLEKSVAYVSGYRIEIEDTKYVEVNKARDTEYYNVATLSAQYGNFIVVNNVKSIPDVDFFDTVVIQDVALQQIGSARIRAIDFISGTPGTAGAVYYVYLFDVKLNANQSISNAVKLVQTRTPQAQFEADVVIPSINNTAENSMVFRLPFSPVDTLRGLGGEIETLYNIKKSFNSRTITGGIVTLTADAESVFPSVDPTDWIATRHDTGAVIDITGHITLGGTPAGTTATIDFAAAGVADGIVVSIIAPLRKNLIEKTKTLLSDVQYTIASPSTTAGVPNSLQKADVFRIKEIYMSGGFGVAPTTSDIIVTDRFSFENGQRENFYDVSTITLKQGALPPTGQLLVVFDYFQHGVGDYFSVDSYTNILYEQIPSFVSRNGVIQLRDAIDFRPRINDIGTAFTGTGASTSDTLKSGSLITADITYYLPRIDKVIVDKNGSFYAKEGISSGNPKPPEDPKEGMVLYELRIPAYTFSPKEVVPLQIDNKRYTMRDIGSLEKRINKLEYYTSLSLLEKQTADTQIFDNGGNTRFKNGFIVDGFYGHNVGDVSHPDYRVSVDKTAGELRPHFYEDNVRLAYDASNSSNIQKSGSVITLAYTEQKTIEQPYASYSEFINPYDVFSWKGSLELSPSQDEWKETEVRPDVIVDNEGIYDSLLGIVEESDAIGTVWNEWQTNWTGESIVSRQNIRTGSQITSQFGGQFLNTFRTDSFEERSTFAITTQQSRSGIRTSVVPDTITTELGDRVVEVNFVPFIRSRRVYFKASKMKPDTRVYLFFDNTDITDFAIQEAFVNFTDNPGEVRVYRPAIGQTRANFVSQSLPFTPTNLVTDENGDIEGSFVIPNLPSIRFKTGTRVVKLTDSPTNTKLDETTSSETVYTASGLIESRENVVVSTRVPTIDRTTLTDSRVVRTTEQRVTGTSTQTSLISQIALNQGGDGDGDGDPLAQTFIIDEPGGAFVTSIDLYVETKDTVPIFVQIRTVENGIPTGRVVPFGEATVGAADINVSADASLPTRFTFPAPVYLLSGVEYSFIVLTKSDKPKIWVSRLGEFDVTNPNFRIIKQPHNGVMFRSQNARTWTPDQDSDIKFVINRAKFSTSTGTLRLNNAPIDSRRLGVDPLTFTSGSSTIRVFHKNHGLFDGISTVVISGVVANSGSDVNNIPITQVNATHTVQNTEQDYYEIVVGTNATATGRAGGNAVRASENKTIDTFHPIISAIEPDASVLTWATRLTTGQSIASKNTQAPHLIESGFTETPINETTTVLRPYTVVSTNDEDILSIPGEKSFAMEGYLSNNGFDNLSPMIDLERASVITVANRIDNPTDTPSEGFNTVADFVPETTAVGTSALSKYITRRIDLIDPADALKIYIFANRPANTFIDVYYKLLESGSDADFQTIDWTLVNPDNGEIPIGDNPNLFSEIEYTLDEADIGGIEFSAFAVKIVLRSSNTSIVPRLKDFRAVAVV